MKKVFLVEDQDDIRVIYTRMIAKRLKDVVVAGESATGEQALKDIPKIQPDLVIVDVSLPGMDGIELVRRLRKVAPWVKALILTAYERGLFLQAAQEAGAENVLEKGDWDGMLHEIAVVLELPRESRGLRVEVGKK